MDTGKMQSVTVELIVTALRELVNVFFLFHESNIITAGQVTRNTDLKMSYKQYDQDIRAMHGVTIEGWPSDIPFAPPSKIKVAYHIKTLHEAWKSGEAYWRVMTSAEQRALKEDLAKREPTARAKRSDTGGHHKCRRKAQSDDEDDERDEGEDEEAEYCPKKKANKGKKGKKGARSIDNEQEEEHHGDGGSKHHSKKGGKGKKAVVDGVERSSSAKGATSRKTSGKRKAQLEGDIDRAPSSKKRRGSKKNGEYVFGPAGVASARTKEGNVVGKN